MYDRQMPVGSKDPILKSPVPFGKYYLLDRINVGGMAEVFQAKAFGVEGFERIVAVKRILSAIAEDKEFISMFIDEAKIAVQLNHANICQVFDLGKVGESYFIALEYVSGRDVRAIFDRCKQRLVDGAPTMPIAQGCFLVMKVCEGLDYAHNKKDSLGHELHLVHRDVSPQNLIISFEGEVKLIDFGIAKAVGQATETKVGILKGKFGYMSPEQVRGLSIDRRSDIFAVGIVLYELLTGERLFVGETDFATLEKVRNVEILPPTMYNRKIPEELERIVLKALAKEVDERYQNAIDLHDDLQAFMYTSGEFYSRKELGSWMKRVFRAEMEQEREQLERFREFKPDQPLPSPPSRMRATQSFPATRGLGKEAEKTGSPSSWTPDSGKPFIPPLPPPPSAGSGQAPVPEARKPSRPPAAAVESAPSEVIDGPEEEEDDEDRADMTMVDGMQGKVANFHWEEEELETNLYDPPLSGPDGSQGGEGSEGGESVEAEAELSSRDVLDLSHLSLPTPSVELLAPVASQQATRAWHKSVPSGSSMVTSVVEGPILLGVQRRTSIGPALAIGGVLVVAVGGLLGYTIFSGQTGELILGAEPSSGISVMVDQKLMDVTESPAQIRLRAGSHQVMVQHEGFLPWTQSVQVRGGETIRRNAHLESLAARTGGFTIISDPPGAMALLDGQKLDQVTPMRVQSVLPGSHTLELRLGARWWKQPISLEAGKMMELRATLSAPEPVKPPEPVKAPEPVKPPEPAKEAVAGKEEPRRPAHQAKEEGKDGEAGQHLSRKSSERATNEGFLRINSKPWTRIIVDGKETGLNTPQTALKLSAGSHQITLHNPAFNVKETFTVSVRSGETATVVKNLLVTE